MINNFCSEKAASELSKRRVDFSVYSVQQNEVAGITDTRWHIVHENSLLSPSRDNDHQMVVVVVVVVMVSTTTMQIAEI